MICPNASGFHKFPHQFSTIWLTAPLIITYLTIFRSAIFSDLHFLWVSMHSGICISLPQTANSEVLPPEGIHWRIKHCLSWPCSWWHTHKPRGIAALFYLKIHYSERSFENPSTLLVLAFWQDENEAKRHERLSNKELFFENIDYAVDLILIFVLTLSIVPGFIYEDTGSHQLHSWYEPDLCLSCIYFILEPFF